MNDAIKNLSITQASQAKTPAPQKEASQAKKQINITPFFFEGKKVVAVSYSAKMTVKNRIDASIMAQELFGKEDGDPILLCSLSLFGIFYDSNGEELKINALELSELLDYNDFYDIHLKAQHNFLAGKNQRSSASSDS
jgi:hypothetical protein